MHLKLTCSVGDPPLGALLTVEYTKCSIAVNVDWGKSTCLDLNGRKTLTTSAAIARYVARLCPSSSLYGSGMLERSEVDHWMELSGTEPPVRLLQRVDRALACSTYLVGHGVTLADLFIWASFHSKWQALLDAGKVPENVSRWYNFLLTQAAVKSAITSLQAQATDQTVQTRDEGKFADLPGAEMGKVVVRFPPEASGYLHVGHAKAALLNQHYQRAFRGQLILRFDDTNPDKEKEDFERVILEDVRMLEIQHDRLTYTSNYFDLLLEKCEELLGRGLAYVDDTDPEVMKAQREQKQESASRSRSIEENLALWREMQQGSSLGLRCCVRAKIDMSAANGCMRDPTLYRCKNVPHPRTGSRYHVYPTYDFACPIVDSVEEVTHALRTTEYHDRDEQYFWILDALGMRKPYIYEYSRLNLMHTVLSKRKLAWLVDTGVVDGWDDPRMPTVRGVLRRGMTVEALRQFIAAQGSSRSVVMMDWDKLWAFNKKVIDPAVPRHTAVEQGVPVTVHGLSAGTRRLPWHPKNPQLGDHDVDIGPELLVDRVDADCMKVGHNVTFIGLGNLRITGVRRNDQGEPVAVGADANLEDCNYKNTLKVTWLCSAASLVPCVCIFFDHIISKGVLSRDEDFKQYVRKDTRLDVPMLADPLARELRKGDIIQIQRKGFFICDQPYDEDAIRHVGRPAPLVLFYVPDGSQSISTLPKAARHFYLRGDSGQGQPNTGEPQKLGSLEDLAKRIEDIGNRVRELKSQKAEKSVINSEVAELLRLKGEYTVLTGKEWTPTSTQAACLAGATRSVTDISTNIRDQGEKVRAMKAAKATKQALDPEIKALLELKAEFKACTGSDWKPGSGDSANSSGSGSKINSSTNAVSSTGPSNSAADLNEKIRAQGEKVRKMKAEKISKQALEPEIRELLQLKAQFKANTGSEWKPETGSASSKEQNTSTADAASSATTQSSASTLSAKVQAQGDKVRSLKAAKVTKDVLEPEIAELLRLKAEFKCVTGSDWKPSTGPAASEKSGAAPENKEARRIEPKTDKKCSVKEEAQTKEGGGPKKVSRLGLEACKEENLADWYSQVITKSEMIEYYDVSGCYILRPWAYGLWENIRDFLDARIRTMGVQNCYFPMFVSSQALEREKTHVADFAPEVAWVTRSGSSELAEPIAIRPTSETVMYPAYAKWIQSHRDLPLQLNQWCNVVRWEFKHPQPFLRTREFLWQEGHSAFASKDEALAEVHRVLQFYADVYEELLAIPVVRGRKTEREKFAGAELTTTVEAYVPASGRGIQGATSHYLGQNFSRMFEIVFEDPDTREKQYVHQTSWGLTTRTIGVLIMVHGDNRGLVLPPRVARVQAIVVPCGITASLSPERRDRLLAFCRSVEAQLLSAGVRCKGDYRDNYSPGWKFNHWELKGVPVRLELGPRDMEQDQVTAVRRDTGQRLTIGTPNLTQELVGLLEDIQQTLFQKAQEDQKRFQATVTSWDDFVKRLEAKCLVLAPFCGEPDCEELIKKHSAREEAEPGAPAMGAKSLCIPFEQPAPLAPSSCCVHPDCSRKPLYYTLFGRSY